MRLVAGMSELAANIRAFNAETGDRLQRVLMLDSDHNTVEVWDEGEEKPRLIQARRVAIHPEEAIAIVTF